MIITIDGPAGSGKSTVAFALARRLEIAYLDTGAMYRAVTLAALQQNICLDDPAALEETAGDCRIELSVASGVPAVLLNGSDITDHIRSQAITNQAHKIACVPPNYCRRNVSHKLLYDCSAHHLPRAQPCLHSRMDHL